MEHTECKYCGADWEGEDIYKALRAHEAYKDWSDERVKEAASHYGWTPENGKKFKRQMSLEIRGVYDGVLYWKCPDCGTYTGRFSGLIYHEIDEYSHKIENEARQKL